MNSRYFDKMMIENAKNDVDIYYVDKAYYIKVLETICEILENEDFPDEITLTSTKDIDCLIEFDKNHNNLFSSFTTPDKLWDNIKHALGLNQLIRIHYNNKKNFFQYNLDKIIEKNIFFLLHYYNIVTSWIKNKNIGKNRKENLKGELYYEEKDQ